MLLAIETATDSCSIALLDDEGMVIGIQEALRPRAHSELLAIMIRDLLAQHAVAPADLKAVAVSAGPGSYTGLRIGVSTAKGICFSTEAHLVGIPTLSGLAHAARGLLRDEDLLLTVLPSRRNEVHIAAFGGSGAIIRPPTSLMLDALPEWISDVSGTVYLAGPAARDVLPLLPDTTQLLNPDVIRPSAEHIGACAMIRLDHNDWDDLGSFEPDYLKPFIPGPARPIFGTQPTTTS